MGQGHIRSRVALVAVLALTTTLVLAASPARAATALCTPDPGWPGVDETATADLIELFDQHRILIGLPALELSPSLMDAASWKSQHMAHYGYLQHNDPAPPQGRTMNQRVSDCGYPGLAGENIARYGSAIVVMQQWLSSPGHRANLEDPNFRVVGAAAARAADGTYYWTLLFGIEEDKAPAVPPTETPAPDPTSSTESARDSAGEFLRSAPSRWGSYRLRWMWRTHHDELRSSYSAGISP